MDTGCGAETKSENETFLSHFQRVKSCESVIHNAQISFLRILKKSIDLGSILTPILDPYRGPELLTMLRKDRLGTEK